VLLLPLIQGLELIGLDHVLDDGVASSASMSTSSTGEKRIGIMGAGVVAGSTTTPRRFGALRRQACAVFDPRKRL